MLEQLAQLAEVIGTFVIVITLIYLSIQVRQGTELLRSEARQAQAAYGLDEIHLFVEHPELGRLFSQADKPEFEEKTKLFFWIIGAMRNREFEWLQFKSGASDEETWLSYRNVIYFVLGTERAWQLWELCSQYFNSDFVNMVAEMMAEVPPIDLWKKLDEVD
jgi:UDP:flavonoid glycosyltransferase YjiC (YdhE family)